MLKRNSFNMRGFWLTIILFVLSGPVRAQSGIIDSLKTVAATVTDSTKKVDALIGLVRIYFNKHADYDSALKYTNVALRISWQIGDTTNIIKTGRIKGQLLTRVGLIDESLHEIGMILPIARRHNSDQLMYLTNIIGMNLTLKARYREALKFLSESLELRRKLNDTLTNYSVITNVGVVFYKMKSYEKALHYFKEAIRLTKKSSDYYLYDNVLINAGLCEAYLGKYPEALKFMNEGMEFNKTTGLVDVTISGHFGLGLVYLKMGDIVKAKINFSESLGLALQQNNTRFIAEDRLYLGKIAYQQGNKENGLTQLLEAERAAKKFEYNELLITIYEEMIAIFKLEQNIQTETIYRDKFIELKAAVYNASLTEGLAENEAVLRAKQNIERIQLQNEILKLNSELLVQQRILILLSCIVAVLVVSVFGMLYLSSRHRKNINRQLELDVESQTISLTDSLKKMEALNERLEKSSTESYNTMRQYSLQLKGLHQMQLIRHNVQTVRKMDDIFDKLHIISI